MDIARFSCEFNHGLAPVMRAQRSNASEVLQPTSSVLSVCSVVSVLIRTIKTEITTLIPSFGVFSHIPRQNKIDIALQNTYSSPVCVKAGVRASGHSLPRRIENEDVPRPRPKLFEI